MDEETFHKDDPRAVSRSEQQRAEVLDHLRTAEEFIVFYRHENSELGPTLVTQLTRKNVFNWMGVVIEELEGLLKVATEAYVDALQTDRPKDSDK
jgi:hypothetical protein